MNTKNFVTITVAEYKELIYASINARYEKSLRDMEEDYKLQLQAKDEEIRQKIDAGNYWFRRWQDEHDEVTGLKAQLAELLPPEPSEVA